MYCYIPLFVMGDLCDGGPPPQILALRKLYVSTITLCITHEIAKTD